ncbi:hypothetical protein FRB91_006387 [Serendipita sp. 411]|nr:hypothetical protein FRB91_006387 [Serendipita sp. 411]
MKRVLLLHGYGGNATIFSKKIDFIRQQCGNDCEFVALDGPISLKSSEIPPYLLAKIAVGARLNQFAGRPPLQIDYRGWWLRGNPETIIEYVKFIITYGTAHTTPLTWNVSANETYLNISPGDGFSGLNGNSPVNHLKLQLTMELSFVI